jgi:hypothetical protein
VRGKAHLIVQGADLMAFGRWLDVRRVAPVLGLVAACALATGCGGNSPTIAGSSPTKSAQTLAFAKCMRAHGVSNFPDPGASISGPYNSIGGMIIPTTINMQSPAFQRAMGSCRGLVSATLSAQGKPPVTATMKASLIAHAQCMRAHGVPGYQDPTFPASGGIAVTDAGTDPQSPAYKQAQAVCGNR